MIVPFAIAAGLLVANISGERSMQTLEPGQISLPVEKFFTQPSEDVSEAATAIPESNHCSDLANAPPTEAMSVSELIPLKESVGPCQSEIVVSARMPSPGDPLETVNAKTFAISQEVDEAVIGPVARTYESKIPEPARNGLRNFLGNLHEPSVMLNFILQHKVGKATETFGRFAVNSTLGLAGLFDVAKRRPFNLSHRSNGFANTMGFYGVKTGAYLFLPIIGPTTVRDLVGYGLDRTLLPFAVGKPLSGPAYNIPTGVLHSLDKRAAFDAQLNKIRTESNDPYVAARQYYLSRRQVEIDGLHSKSRATIREDADHAKQSVSQ